MAVRVSPWPVCRLRQGVRLAYAQLAGLFFGPGPPLAQSLLLLWLRGFYPDLVLSSGVLPGQAMVAPQGFKLT